jgi:predicted negative regulator of RcsB-dependent stress response
LAEQLKADYSSSTYAQFAALHLAAMAVQDNSLSEAEAQLRWVLGKASSGSDIAQIAQLRLARVLASSGDTDQALAILAGEEGSFSASYAIARGDVLLGAGRTGEARDAYTQALALSAGAGGNLQVLQQKVQSLTPVPPKELQTPPDSAIGESATIPAVDIVEEN